MKNARHEQILLLIEKYEIETQEELAERLNQAGTGNGIQRYPAAAAQENPVR